MPPASILEEYEHSGEARDDNEIHTKEEYIWKEVQKLPKDR
jgi:hypothetical protein